MPSPVVLRHIVIAAILLLATATGLSWRRRAVGLDPLDRLGVALAPTVVVALVLALAGSVIHGALFYWNPPRLVGAVALTRGYHLYYDAASGPVLNTLYPPLSTLVYLPCALFGTPFGVTACGAVIGAVFFFGPVLAIIAVARERNVAWGWVRPLYAWATFVMLALTSFSLKGSAFFQPADPIAFGFAAICCGGLGAYLRRPQARWLALSAAGVALAVWSKQTMAPLIVALPLYLLAVRGRAATGRYIALLAALGLGLTALVVAAFRPLDNLVFNIFVIHSHHPVRHDAVPLLYLRTLVHDCREWPLMLAIVGVALALVQRLPAPDGEGPAWRRRLRAHPWLLYVWVALWLLPTSYLGFMKEGGRTNSMSLHTYFLTLAGSLCLLGRSAFPTARAAEGAARPGRSLWSLGVAGVVVAFGARSLLGDGAGPGGPGGEPLRGTLLWLGIWLLATLLVAVTDRAERLDARLDTLARASTLTLFWLFAFEIVPFSLGQLDIDRAHDKGPVLGSYAFARRHPGEVFFPYDPLTTLFTDGALYHFDYGLFDRRLAGYAVDEAHFRAHLPPHLTYVLYPRWVAQADTPRESLRYLSEFSELVHPRGLDEWDVYMRPEDAAELEGGQLPQKSLMVQ